MKSLQKKAKKRNNKGFSLVELIVVIAIMAVLIAVMAPQFIRYVDRSRQSNDATLVSSIVTAVQTGVSDIMTYDIPADTYTVTLKKGSNLSITKSGGGAVAAQTDSTKKGTIMDAIQAACGTDLSKLAPTARAWTADTITIQFEVTSDSIVNVAYDKDFAKYIDGKAITTP